MLPVLWLNPTSPPALNVDAPPLTVAVGQLARRVALFKPSTPPGPSAPWPRPVVHTLLIAPPFPTSYADPVPALDIGVRQPHAIDDGARARITEQSNGIG